MTKEITQWLDTDEWNIALKLHSLMCPFGHAMDECWGLMLPYDLAQPELSAIQQNYLTMAQNLVEAVGIWHAYAAIDALERTQ